MTKLVQFFNRLGITNDKVMHFVVGAILSIILGIFLHNALLGLYAGIVAGIAKEVYDKYDYGLFDTKDMLATWAGAIVAYLLNLVICS